MPVSPRLQTAIDAVLLAGQNQLHWLDRNPHPPLAATFAEALAHYGGPRAALSLWSMVRAIDGLIVAIGSDRADSEVPEWANDG